MKKHFYTLIVLAFFVVVCEAQIPNNSFENWINMGSYSNPDEWGTMNNTSGSVITATKGKPGNPGEAYLKLTSKTIATGVLNGIAVSGILDTITMQPKSGFAYNLRPLKFTGKWQHMIFGNSQGAVTAVLTKWNGVSNERDTIAVANKLLTGMAMSWATFTINFSYLNADSPDSCIIFLRASGSNPANEDYLWVDNMAFEGTAVGIDNVSLSNVITFYPNPAKNEIIIETVQINETAYLCIYNIRGKELIKQSIEGDKTTIRIDNLATGMYLIKKCNSLKCTTIGKFMKD